MKAAWLYRIGAAVLVLFAVLHTIGFLSFKPPIAEGLAVRDAMTNVHFEINGSNLGDRLELMRGPDRQFRAGLDLFFRGTGGVCRGRGRVHRLGDIAEPDLGRLVTGLAPQMLGGASFSLQHRLQPMSSLWNAG